MMLLFNYLKNYLNYYNIMEVINPYLGKYSGSSVFLNNGKYGFYLNHIIDYIVYHNVFKNQNLN